jgi:hypothetical protein
MVLIRWTLLRELATMQERMNKLFEDTLKAYAADEGLAVASWAPASTSTRPTGDPEGRDLDHRRTRNCFEDNV